MSDEERWLKKIREILRRARKYANEGDSWKGRRKERVWWWKRWQDEYHRRVLELIRLAEL